MLVALLQNLAKVQCPHRALYLKLKLVLNRYQYLEVRIVGVTVSLDYNGKFGLNHVFRDLGVCALQTEI